MSARRTIAFATLAAMLPASIVPAGATNLALVKAPNQAAVPAPSDLRILPGEGPRKFTLGAGRSSIVQLPEDASEIFIGNPQVANAVVRSARKLFVLGIAPGQTTIFALDKTGRRIATLELVINSRDVGDLSAILRTAMPSSDIRVQAVNDTIILTGFVDSAVDAQKAQDIAGAYVGYTAVGGGGAATGSGGGSSVSFGSTQVVSGNLINSLVIREKEQVMLKVSVVEVQRAVLKQLGVNLSAGSMTLNGRTTGIGSFMSPSGSTENGVNGFATGTFLSGGTALNATMQAFERNGVAHVLAEPTVTAISGESAKFTAGGTIPVITGSDIGFANGRSSCKSSIEQKPYGVVLNFTPTVLSEGRISLHLSTEVTEQDPSQHVVTCGNSNTFGFRTRQNETTVELPSGGSLVTAGLIQQSDKQAISGTPGLMNLPILGALFRSRDYQRDESELMIIVTPYIARTLRPDQIAKPDDGFQSASDPQGWFLGRINRIYSRRDNPEIVRDFRGRVGFIND